MFTPLVQSTCGGMLHETTTFYKKHAADLAAKRKPQYSEVLGWLRCRNAFAILLASRKGDVPRP